MLKMFQELDTDSVKKKLGLDARDMQIISMVQTGSSQEEIASALKISQPSVGSRIKKLVSKGVLSKSVGFDFSKVDMQLAKIDIRATDTAAVVSQFHKCPFFVNALVVSGRYNLCVFFAATELRKLEEIVNKYVRSNPAVKELEMNVVISSSKPLVLPVELGDCSGCGTCDEL